MKNEGQTPERAEDFKKFLRLSYEEDHGTILVQDHEWLKNYRAVNAPRKRREDPRSSGKSSARTSPDQESR